MFVLRQVKEGDHEGLHRLALQLGAAGSLSQDKDRLKEQVAEAIDSFRNPSRDRSKAKYIFILEDYLNKTIIGCSTVTGKFGDPQNPNTYLSVFEKTREDESTQVKVTHQLLRFEFDEDGPSYIGGLILDESFRNSPAGLGRLLSWGRFLYMGAYKERFEDTVTAELLPPFNEKGESELWEAFGRRFTGMSYQDADRLSRTNKDFIKHLFPTEDIYTSLFDEKTRSVVGQTGKSTRAAQKLLEKIGFSYFNAVDPFDGGPHFSAKVKEITLIKRMQKARISKTPMTSMGNRSLVACPAKEGFLCMMIHTKKELKDLIQIGPDAYEVFKREGLANQDVYYVSPL